jgi:predicted transcriptional regulator
MLGPSEVIDKDGGSHNDFRGMAAEIVSAYVRHNALSSNDVPQLLADVHSALQSLGTQHLAKEQAAPAVPIKKSVTPDALICLEDGKTFKSLKRHLRVHHGMTPDDYRRKWSLPNDYPMVALNYSATRSSLAKEIGLGKTPKGTKSAKGRSRSRT